VVAQGEPVREGQKMIQIPDLTQMIPGQRAACHNPVPVRQEVAVGGG